MPPSEPAETLTEALQEANASWPATPPPRGGLRGWLASLVERLLAPRLEAQRSFNAAQVRLDNALARQLDERLAATHAHYDALLGAMQRRQDEADQRHRELERELLVHVRDLVERIDVVLVEARGDRHALAQTLEETRARLARLEQSLGPR